MKRDITEIPLNDKESLVITADNSGGIGLKAHDIVQTSYEVVSYYGFRVAVMECMAAGGTPLAVVLHNFSGDDAWQLLVKGIERGLEELGLADIPITGSTESNFSLVQSAIGIIVMGKKDQLAHETILSVDNMKLAVIGSPLVGNEVLEREHEVLPLSLFQELCQLQDVVLLPVGSKGILHELRVLLYDKVPIHQVDCDVDLDKSSGPATCCLVAYDSSLEQHLQDKCGQLFHRILVK
jgi:hypothetical protein